MRKTILKATTSGRGQAATGLVVYPVRRADGRVVWVTVPRK